MRISNKTLELIEEEAFFSDIPVDRLLKIYQKAYNDATPVHLSREEHALNRVKLFVKESETAPVSKTLSTIRRILMEDNKKSPWYQENGGEPVQYGLSNKTLRSYYKKATKEANKLAKEIAKENPKRVSPLSGGTYYASGPNISAKDRKMNNRSLGAENAHQRLKFGVMRRKGQWVKYRVKKED